jgi:hypothetical protein
MGFFFFYLLLYVLPAWTFRSQHFEISCIYQKCKTYIFLISHCVHLLLIVRIIHKMYNIKFCMFLCLMIPTISNSNFCKEKWLVPVMETMEDELGDEFFEYSLRKFHATEARCALFFIILWFIFCAGTCFVFSGLVWNVLQLSLRNLGDEVVDLPHRGTVVIFIYNKMCICLFDCSTPYAKLHYHNFI